MHLIACVSNATASRSLAFENDFNILLSEAFQKAMWENITADARRRQTEKPVT